MFQKTDELTPENTTMLKQFDSHAAHRWAADHRVDLHFIGEGKPQQSAFIESYND